MKQKDISEHEFDTSSYIEMKTLMGDLRAENKRLREALMFYADPLGYQEAHGECRELPDFYDEMDFGDKAKQALKGNINDTK